MMHKGELALEVLEGVEVDEATESAFINDVVMRASNLLWGMRSPERSRRLIDDALKTARGVRRLQLLVFRANQLALGRARLRFLRLWPMSIIRTSTSSARQWVMAPKAWPMANSDNPIKPRQRLSRADQALMLSEQGKFLRQPLTEFHTFALVAAGRIAEAIEVAERNLRAQREEPAAVRAVASETLGMVMLAAGDLDTALRASARRNRCRDGEQFPRGQQLPPVPLAACAGAGPVRRCGWRPIVRLPLPSASASGLRIRHLHRTADRSMAGGGPLAAHRGPPIGPQGGRVRPRARSTRP